MYQYDVGLSFAEEDRAIALCIYLALKLHRPSLNIYYYPVQAANTVGRDLRTELPEIYGHQCKCVVMIVSSSYVNKHKVYVPMEISALVKRHQSDTKNFLIPLLTDATRISEVDAAFVETTAWLKWNFDAEGLSATIGEMINKPKENAKEVATQYRDKYETTFNGKVDTVIIGGRHNK